MSERIVTPEWIDTQRKYHAAGVFTPANMLHALDEVERLTAAVERVRALHQRAPKRLGLHRPTNWCLRCGSSFPCCTLRALEEKS